jgi:hypothetical protein
MSWANTMVLVRNTIDDGISGSTVPLVFASTIQHWLTLIKQEKHALSSDDWEDLKVIADVCKLVHLVTLHFEKTEAMLSEVPVWISGLIQELTSLSTKSRRHNHFCFSLTTAIRKRFASALHPKGPHVQAALLDPRFKDLSFLTQSAREDAWQQFCEEQVSTAPAQNNKHYKRACTDGCQVCKSYART